MIEGSLKPFLGGTTQVDSDERTGKLIIVTRQENVETLEFILETLDAPVKMKTTSKLFKLQHAETKDIQSILDEVIKNQQRIKQQVQGRKNAARPTAGTTAGKPAAATPAATAAQTAADQIKDQAFSELAALIEESDKLLKSSANLVGEEGETLREQVALKLKQAMDSVTNVRERTQPMVDATETYIGGHPWQTVAISAGFGLVVGLLLGRRN